MTLLSRSSTFGSVMLKINTLRFLVGETAEEELCASGLQRLRTASADAANRSKLKLYQSDGLEHVDGHTSTAAPGST